MAVKDKRAKDVIYAENHYLMRKGGLWLTCGGRVVKPGWGEYASEQCHDILLMTSNEIESGIEMAEFERRYKIATRLWKANRRRLDRWLKRRG